MPEISTMYPALYNAFDLSTIRKCNSNIPHVDRGAPR
jgi:hypothetical protein